MHETEKEALIEIARRAVGALVAGTSDREAPRSSALARPAAAFVSVYVDGHLRGCIGHIEADMPLAEVVARCARAACADDPRFAPVTADDLPGLSLELSVLEPFERILGPDAVEIGRHGLLVEEGRRRGLLLPQVAMKYAWDAPQFIEETCRKAGLLPGAWRHGAQLWRFTAEVFGAPFAVSGERAHGGR